MSWRNEAITDSQRRYMAELREFSEFPLPKFVGTTRGEASDWIDQNSKKAHTMLVDAYESTR